MGRVTPLSKIPNGKQTTAQEKLWAVLQEEKNHDLPIGELCRMAGYRSMTPWYRAMKDDAFRSRVEALGIAVNGSVILRPDNFDPLLNNYRPVKTI